MPVSQRYALPAFLLASLVLLAPGTASAQTTLSSDVTSATPLVYTGAVLIDGDVTITAPSVTFQSTINGTTEGADDLTIVVGDADGVARFGGQVGGATRLATLTTSGPGTTEFAANTSNEDVYTTGDQSYNRSVVENGIQTFRTINGAITFESTLDGGQRVHFLMGGSGSVVFNGVVGGITPLAALYGFPSGGTFRINTTAITTQGEQWYRNTVIINPGGSGTAATTTLTTFTTSGGVWLGYQPDQPIGSEVDGEDALVVAAARDVRFDGPVGNTGQRLAGLTATSPAGTGTMVERAFIVNGISAVEHLDLYPTADLIVEIAGTTPGTDYHQVQVTGSADVAGADLVVTLDDHVPLQGDTFTILTNDEADAVTGTFSGLPEGSTLTVDGIDFTISYVGGDGNDIVLTASSFDLLVDTISDNQPYDASGSLDDCTDSEADGDCTLREAIQVANANAGLDAIGFHITEAQGATASGQATITPGTALPVLTDADLSILGYTQFGASRNTLATGSDAVVQIVLDGSTASGFQNGLEVASSATGAAISGLSIVDFGNAALRIEGADAVIEGNYLGVLPDGTTAGPNGYGVFTTASGPRIGTDGDSEEDEGERNVISGNAFMGANVNGDGATVAGNYIGLTAAGTAALANAEYGLSLDTGGTNAAVTENVISGNTLTGLLVLADGASVHRNVVGLDATGQSAIPNADGGVAVGNTGAGISAAGVVIQDNVVSGNSGDGVSVGAASTAFLNENRIGFDTDGVDLIGNTDAGIEVTGTAEASIRENRIAGNGGLGIDLVGGTEDGFGVTANDAGDPDDGPNQLQNHPTLTLATLSGSDVTVTYLVDTATANATYPLRVELFLADADAQEGQTFLGAVDYAEGAAQTEVTTTFSPEVAVSYNDEIVATATDADGNTSEFSSAVTLVSAAVTIAGDAGWRMLSAPVSAFTASDLADDTAVQGVSGSALPGAEPNLYLYPNTETWTTPTDLGTPWGDGLGFLLYFFDNDEFDSQPLPLILDASGDEPGTDVVVDVAQGGFTLLGNPFVQNLDLDQLTGNGTGGVNGGLVGVVQVWDDGTGTPSAGDPAATTGSFVPVNFGAGEGQVVAAWQGFFAESLAATGATSVTLPYAARTTDTPDVAYFSKRGQADSIAVRRLDFTLAGPEGSGALDRAARLYFHEAATAAPDGFDATKLTPLLSAYATLAFVQHLPGGTERLLAQDGRALDPAETQTYELAVTAAGLAGTFTLAWPVLENIPADWRLTLTDLATGERIDLRERAEYRFEGSSETAGKAGLQGATATALTARGASPASASAAAVRFRLEVASAAATAAEAAALPSETTLASAYPNPFREAARLGYALSRPGAVRLSVYDLLGREVAVVVDAQQAAGRYEARWVPRGLASGLYVARLTVEGRRWTRTLSLVR